MIIAAVIGYAVLMSLRTLADKLHYETTLHHLRLETRRMRLEYIRRTEGPVAGSKRIEAAPAAIAVIPPAPTPAATLKAAT